MERETEFILPPRYLLSGSRESIENLLLNELRKARNTRKQILELINQWIEEESTARLAEWFLRYGDELMALSGPAAEPPLASTERPGPQRMNLTAELAEEMHPDTLRAIARNWTSE